MGYHRIERKILDMGNSVGETGCWQTRIAGIERPKVPEEVAETALILMPVDT